MPPLCKGRWQNEVLTVGLSLICFHNLIPSFAVVLLQPLHRKRSPSPVNSGGILVAVFHTSHACRGGGFCVAKDGGVKCLPCVKGGGKTKF